DRSQYPRRRGDEAAADRWVPVREGALRGHRGAAERLHLPLSQLPVADQRRRARNRFRPTGTEPRSLQRMADSGRTNIRMVCPESGSGVSGVPREGVVRLRGGTLDDTFWLRPTRHIWIRSKQAWVMIPEGDEIFEGQPP